MKVLMFGWEYPPHVFGGLATANYGISEGLKAQGDIETVLCLPHPFGDESQHACRIVAMNAVPIAYRDVSYDYVKQRVGNIMDPDYYFKLREHIYADFNYMNVNDLGAMEFAGGYPGNLHEEINNYSIIAGQVARSRLAVSLCAYTYTLPTSTARVVRLTQLFTLSRRTVWTGPTASCVYLS